MKVAFCVDDNPRYLPLLKVAARSLRAVEGADAQCLCVYAGDNPQVLETLDKERIPLSRYSPKLNRNTLPQSVWFSIGCFLKLELALVPELERDDFVLYCDVDVLFRKPLAELFNTYHPPYMAMAREHTAPFYHNHPSLSYAWQNRSYTVQMPFPIWTFSSGVALFNLKKLRQHHLIDHFLAFSQENAERIGNLDQSLLNYYFGKKITKLPDIWNCPPYLPDSLEQAHIVHFHGPKPWETKGKALEYLRVNHFDALRKVWMSYLDEDERALVKSWEPS